MKKENLLFIAAGSVCAAGCLVISALNVYWSSHPKADVIPPSEYTVSLRAADTEESSNTDELSDTNGQTDEQTTPLHETININTATADELSAFLPGIGDVKAQRIVAYRETAGGFDSVDELLNVKGIGEKTLENIRPYCRVSDE